MKKTALSLSAEVRRQMSIFPYENVQSSTYFMLSLTETLQPIITEPGKERMRNLRAKAKGPISSHREEKRQTQDEHLGVQAPRADAPELKQK